MMLAGTVDLVSLLNNLATSRPVFHSEADFQQAFAWEAQRLDAQMHVRLETHPEPNVRLDLLLSSPDRNLCSAVELKYLTRRWTGDVAGETFALKDQGAGDIHGYDVVKDIARVERFVDGRPGWNGAMITLTNDSSYWRPVSHGRPTNADAFRLYEGLKLSGTRAWGPATGVGTMRGRTDSIELVGVHNLEWRDYSRVPGTCGSFRALIVEISP